MKRLIFIILLLISITTFSQRKIKKVEVLERGFKVTLRFNPVMRELNNNGLILNVKPISPDSLNVVFLGETYFSGNFEYSHFENNRVSYFMKKVKPKREKSDIEFFLEGTQWLLENEIVGQTEYEELVKQIYFYFDEETGNELFNVNKIISANPFYIGDKYLNVFKIEISNLENTYQIFEPDITIQYGNQIQIPLAKTEIIDQLKNINSINNQKIQALNRHLLPETLTIPPNSKFEKLFAIYPIDYNNNELLISIKGMNKKLIWKIEKEEKNISDLYKYLEFDIEYSYNNYTTSSGINFNIINNAGDRIFLDNNLLCNYSGPLSG